jgi:hypothetical protein
MKTKIFALLCLSILSLVLLGNAISAALAVSPGSLSINEFEPQTFIIENTAGSSIDVVLNSQTINDEDGNEAIISFNETSFSIPASSQKTIKASVQSVDDDFNIGTFSKNYVIEDVGDATNNATLTLSFTKSFCDYDNKGDLRVKIDDISVVTNDNLKSFGDDDEWYPLDEIQVDVNIENRGDWKIKDIELEWGVYDKSSKQWIIEPDNEKKFDLKDGKEETITLNFKLDTKTLDVDFDELDEDNVLVVKATGEIDEGEFEGNLTCAGDSNDVSIIIEDDFVILNNFDIPETASCGSNIHVSADVWNIGDDDQNDVYVLVDNKALGLDDERIDIGDIDAFDKEKLDFDIPIPKNLTEGYYGIEFSVYDDNNDIYEDGNNDKSVFTFPLQVEGNCQVSQQASSATITASLESEATAGKELIVKATIKNTGSALATYTIGLSGYSSWATLDSIDQSSVVLNAGESRDVLINFKVNDDSTGDQSFYIEALSNGVSVLKQPVAVYIGETETSPLSNIFTNQNWYLWAIGIVNVILVIAIIIVALRIAKK